SSPRPLNRAAAIAAASVTRATSSTSTRSSPPIVSCPWMLFCIAPSPSRYLSPASQRLDTYHLRLLGHLSILVDGLERGADGLLGGLMGDEDHGRGRAELGARVDAGLRPARPPLHDALQGHAALAHAAGAAGHGARPVEQGEAHVVGALVPAEPGALVGLQLGRRYAEGRRRGAAGDVEDVAHHRRRR